MGQFCIAYPLGIGMYCRDDDQAGSTVDITRPVSYVFTAFQREAIHFSQICSRLCSCHTIGPDEPDIQEPSRGRIQGQDTDEEVDDSPASTQGIISTVHIPQETISPVKDGTLGTVCDGRLYGHPLYADCGAALHMLPDYNSEDARLNREYLGIGAQPTWGSSLKAVQTPQILTSGKWNSRARNDIRNSD